MKPEQQTSQSKLPYGKPRLRVIKLLGAQVLGIGCKAVDSGVLPVPVREAPIGCGLGTPCLAAGS